MDLEKFIDGLHDYLARALSPLASRIKALEARPQPKDGIDGKDGRDGIDGKDGPPGADGIGKDGERGKDGCDGKDGERGADGKSITVHDVAPLLEQLIEQKQAKWELDFERRAQNVLERAVDRLPRPKDGRDGVDGKDGRDALEVDDLVVERSGDRDIVIKLQRGDVVKQCNLSFPVMIYRGVYAEGRAYEVGDTATFAGGLWHCDAPTSDKPGEPGSKGWTLAAKRGRDGKDGRDLAPRPVQPIKVS